MQIGSRHVGSDNPTLIVAEVGSTHNGSLDSAKESIDVAASVGADAVKFQTFRANEMYPDDGETDLYQTVAKAEMPYEWIPQLHEHCQKAGVEFLSTPLDPESANQLNWHVPAFKVASSSLSHYPLLRHLASFDKPIIASTGAHDLSEVKRSVSILQDSGATEIILLHCVSSYPTPLEKINVRAVSTLKENFEFHIGFSDHTLHPTIAPCAAVALGACVIEKHFTLDSSQEGMDHSHSLEPPEFEELVSSIRATESALGDGKVTIQDIERDWYEDARRSIQATTNIEPGDVINEENVGVFRSASKDRGLDPKHLDSIIGEVASSKISSGQGVNWDHLDFE